MLTTYNSYSVGLRLAIMCTATTVLNAIYCLLYTYFAGNPETVFNALAWGVINIVPWVAAVEITRHFRSLMAVFCALTGAMAVSLAIEPLIYGEYRESLDFEAVRRLPSLAVSAAALTVLALKSAQDAKDKPSRDVRLTDFEWARAAGNYVELHNEGAPPQLVRLTLSALLESDTSGLCQIHRSYVVRRHLIVQMDRQGALLKNGKRLPVGNAYRDALNFIPSSQPA